MIKKFSFLLAVLVVLFWPSCEIPQKRITKITQVYFVYVGQRVVPQQFVVATSKVVTEPGDRTVTKVTNFSKGRIITTPSMSPDGGTIVFSNYSGQYWNLQAVNIGKPGIKNITRGPWLDFWPTFGPEGKQIYFCSNRASESFRISRVSKNGIGGIGLINSGPDGVICVDIDKKGKMVFSAPNVQKTYQIWVADLNGGLSTQLTVGEYPRWGFGKNEGKILFSRKDPRTGFYQIWVMSMEGGDETKLTDSEGSNVNAVWAPDGERIAFASNRNQKGDLKYNYDIYEMKSDGSDVVRMTSNNAYDGYPMYSPDGKFIYFLSSRGESWNIWRINR